MEKEKYGREMIRAMRRPGALLLLIVALLIYGMFNLLGSFVEPIHADGVGYSMYLPAWIVHHSFGVEEAVRSRFGEIIPPSIGCERVGEEGLLIDKYGVGVAVMALPFFLTAHFLTWLMAAPGALEWWAFQFSPDGFSGFYQHAMGLAGLFYMWLGVVVSHWHLRRYFTRKTAAWTIGILVAGSNLFYYMTTECVFSHGYSYALFSLLLVMADRWQRGNGTLWTAVCAGCLAGLIGMVRVSNLLFVPCVLLWGIGNRDAWSIRLVQGWQELITATGCAIMVFSFQLWTWHCMGGHWLMNAYGAQGEGFSWGHPEILNVLFSLRGGVFFWSPILLTGVLGLFVRRKGECSPWKWVVAVYVPLQFWIVASWHDWAYGGGFGHRGFIETYALWVFPMAAWVEFCERQNRWLRWGNRIACLGGVFWNLFFMKLCFIREVSGFGLDRQALFDIVYNRTCAFRTWLRSLQKP